MSNGRRGMGGAIFLLLFATIPAFAQPSIFAQPLSPRIANYTIDVSLDTAKRSLAAHEVLVWHNRTGDVIADMPFHLYLNGFRNNRSTLISEGGALRGMELDPDTGWGYSEIQRIAVPGGPDLTDRIEFIHPDDDNELDRTVFRLPLSQPLRPGDSIVLEIDFAARLPAPPFRTGRQGEFYFVGQWYPKPGVYIDGAWNCHQFHAASEFFADFGVYDVKIRVPVSHVVGATGVEVEVLQNGDGTATHYYHAEDVHDFAWTSSPDFLVYQGDTDGVAIRLLMQPDHVRQASRCLDAAKKAIGYMHDWIGEYPYPNLTVVDPRRKAPNAGGMEYATLFTTFNSYGFPSGLRLQESATVHEFAHQYWQGMVATNEFEEAWLDEGMTAYSEAKMMSDLWGPEGDLIDLFGIHMGSWTYARAPVVDAGGYDRMGHAAWASYSDNIGGINAYFKMAMLLRTLENYLGPETMQRVMRTYFERWRFRHPHTRDFLDVVNEVSGRDFDWYFNQALNSNATLDYSVSRVTTKEVPKAKGYDFTLTLAGDKIDSTSSALDDGEDPDSGSVVAGQPDSASDSAGTDTLAAMKQDTLYRSEVKVRRLGTFVFPVTIEVVFADSTKVREQWDGRDAWIKYVYVRPSKLAAATVDPDRQIPLDVCLTNNSLTVEPEGVGIAKARVRMLFWAQFLMEQPDFANLATLWDGLGLP